jgi:hypothetical protein
MENILDMDDRKRKDKRSIELFACTQVKRRRRKKKNELLFVTNDDTVYSMKAYTLAYNTIIIKIPTYDRCFCTHIQIR